MLTVVYSAVRRAGRNGAIAVKSSVRSMSAALASEPAFSSAPEPSATPVQPLSPMLAATRPTVSFVVPLGYDFTKSTRDNYQQDPSEGAQNYGRYKHIRDHLDTAYHGTYTRARQEMQDELIRQVVGPHKAAQASPWIVFTAGAMVGARARAERGSC
jgi:hypothetical protein